MNIECVDTRADMCFVCLYLWRCSSSRVFVIPAWARAFVCRSGVLAALRRAAYPYFVALRFAEETCC